MKELLERLKAAEERANKADQAWEQEPESAEKENEFNEAYKEEYKAFEALAAGIVKVTAGKIDRKTAGKMIRMKRNELEALLVMMQEAQNERLQRISKRGNRESKAADSREKTESDHFGNVQR